MVRTIDEIMNLVKERIGDSTEDSDISFVEDISDTLNHIGSEGNERIESLQAENKILKEKYRDRFFSGGNKDEKDDDNDDNDDGGAIKTYEDLFTVKKED